MNKIGVFFLTWLVAAPSGFFAGTYWYASLDVKAKNRVQERIARISSIKTRPWQDARRSVPSGPSIEQRCIQRWGTNYRMREYCERNQREALAKLGGR